MNRRRFLGWTACAAAAGALAGSTKTQALAAEASTALPDVWGDGELLAFSALDGPTDYAAGLVARTMAQPVAVEIVLPASLRIEFSRRAGRVVLTSDGFDIETATGRVRGVLLDAHHLLIEGRCTLGEVPPELAFAQQGLRTLVGAKAHFAGALLHAGMEAAVHARQRWLRTRSLPPGLSDTRRRTLIKTIAVMKGQVCTAEGLIHHRWTTPDRWPHRDLWLWDSVFHAIGWRHLDAALAREMIEAVFDGQQPDGRIPHQLSPLRASKITQPPVLAQGIRAVMGGRTDRAWLRKLYPKLTRYLEWDFTHRVKAPDGLAQWKIDGNPLSRSGESGMDNSPRFDKAVGLGAVDFNAFLSQECEVMAEFAQTLDRAEDAKAWRARHEALNRQINAYCWDEEAGFYFDYDPVARARTGVFAATGFLPLLCGAADARQAARLVSHLRDPRRFATAAPVASALLQPGMPDPQDMWRGPMWVNMNWLIAEGLERYGRRAEARTLRVQTMDVVERWYLQLGSVFEFYDETGKAPPDRLPRKGSLEPGSAYHQAIHDYGWTATLYTDLVYRTASS